MREEIPKVFRFTCDRCKQVVIQEEGFLPPAWSWEDLVFYVPQSEANRCLCASCLTHAHEMIYDFWRGA